MHENFSAMSASRKNDLKAFFSTRGQQSRIAIYLDPDNPSGFLGYFDGEPVVGVVGGTPSDRCIEFRATGGALVARASVFLNEQRVPKILLSRDAQPDLVLDVSLRNIQSAIFDLGLLSLSN